MIIGMTLLAVFGGQNIELLPQRTVDSVPDSSEIFLQAPTDVAVDADNRIYVLDLQSRVVFIWDADGRFVKYFGQEGQGPGEFNFRSNMGGRQGYINIVDERVYVYDGGNRVVNRFSLDGVFEDGVRFELPNGRAEQFRMIRDDQWLVFNSSYTAQEPFRQIGTYNPSGELMHTFIKAPDQTWRYESSARNGVILHVYSPSLYMHYNRANDTLVIGNSAQPAFSVYKPDGTLIQEVQLPLVQAEVTEADIAEYEDQAWIKQTTFFKTEYPETKSFYDKVLPVGDSGFLVFTESPVEAKCVGVYASREKIIGRFSAKQGNGGTLLGTSGLVFSFAVDDEGDFRISEVLPKSGSI